MDIKETFSSTRGLAYSTCGLAYSGPRLSIIMLRCVGGKESLVYTIFRECTNLCAMKLVWRGIPLPLFKMRRDTEIPNQF